MGLANRVRDDRGRRDLVNDGVENSADDHQPFDEYGGQDAIPSFPSDVPPPPVLMPVPGAGLVIFPNAPFQ